MPSAYPQRALSVLLLFGTSSAAMALLSSSLIFQLPSGRAGTGAGGGRGALPEPVAAALLPVSAVLAALCLLLNVSCLLLCLLHGSCGTELGRGQPGPERALWFLLDSRSVRHAAIGLFCCGLCLYLTALALSVLLLFELEAGIASACILTSGILLLLISLLHVLLRASHISHTSHIPRGPELSQALYENDPDRENAAPPPPPRPRPEIHREFSFPPFLEGKSQPGSASSSNLSCKSKEFPRESQWELSRSKESQCQDWSRSKEFPRESQWELSRSKESQPQDWSRSKEFPRESQWELSRSKESQPQDWSRSKEFPRESQEWSRSKESQSQNWSRSKEFPRESQDWCSNKEIPQESQWELPRSKEFPRESQDWPRSKEFSRESQWELSRIKEFPRESQWELSRSKESQSQEFPSQDWSRSKEFPRESQQELFRSKEFPFQNWSRIKEFPRESQWELSRSKESQSQEFPFQNWSRSKEFPRESQDWTRTHGTLLDSGLLQGNPWNVSAREMRNGTAHKATRDSTLV